MTARIACAKPIPPHRWELPWTLLVLDLCGWRPVSRHRTETQARAAAHRRGWKLA